MGKLTLSKLKAKKLKSWYNEYKHREDADVDVMENVGGFLAKSAPKRHTINTIKMATLQKQFGVRKLGLGVFEPIPTIPPVEPPGDLLTMRSRFQRVTRADTDMYNEPMSRSLIDLVMVTAMDICQQGLGPAPVEIGLLKYETDLQCIVSGPEGSHELSGRADYCVGYGGTEQQEANLAVIEAKRPTEYGEARTQVLGYMTTVAHLRAQKGKTNTGIYGITSDGNRFRFYYMSCDREFYESTEYNWEKNSTEVFTYVCHVLSGAMQLSPTTTWVSMPSENDHQEWMGIHRYRRMYKTDI